MDNTSSSHSSPSHPSCYAPRSPDLGTYPSDIVEFVPPQHRQYRGSSLGNFYSVDNRSGARSTFSSSSSTSSASTSISSSASHSFESSGQPFSTSLSFNPSHNQSITSTYYNNNPSSSISSSLSIASSTYPTANPAHLRSRFSTASTSSQDPFISKDQNPYYRRQNSVSWSLDRQSISSSPTAPIQFSPYYSLSYLPNSIQSSSSPQFSTTATTTVNVTNPDLDGATSTSIPLSTPKTATSLIPSKFTESSQSQGTISRRKISHQSSSSRNGSTTPHSQTPHIMPTTRSASRLLASSSSSAGPSATVPALSTTPTPAATTTSTTTRRKSTKKSQVVTESTDHEHEPEDIAPTLDEDPPDSDRMSPTSLAVTYGIQIKTKFPPARIKRIMQADEDVGKVSQVVPPVVARALELFMIALVLESADQANARSSRRVTSQHFKQAVLDNERFDFLRDIVNKVPANSALSNNPSASKSRSTDDNHADPVNPSGSALDRKRHRTNTSASVDAS